MIHSIYLWIHNRIKLLKDKNNLIKRKEIIFCLKYQPKIDKYVREIIIREMCEMNLLRKVNRDTLKWIPCKNSEYLKDKSKAWKMAKLHATWWSKDKKK